MDALSSQPPAPTFNQTIAHRGYKAKYPENSLEAAKGAVQAGTNAIETDLRITRDGVIVLSHDRSLKRCFGVDKKVDECDWEYLKTLRTLKEPHVALPRLSDLLEYLVQPGLEHIWVLLDIKLDNVPEVIIPLLSELFASIPSPLKPWSSRIVLGCWSSVYFPLCKTQLPDFEAALICFDLHYARQVLRTSAVSFNVAQKILMGPLGRGFLEEARAAGRRVYVWTVNEPSLMRWCIRKKVDGMITDDPELYRRVLEGVKAGSGGKGGLEAGDEKIPVSLTVQVWLISFLMLTLGWLLRRRLLGRVEKRDKSD